MRTPTCWSITRASTRSQRAGSTRWSSACRWCASIARAESPEVLRDAGLGADCVADYLDVEGMAGAMSRASRDARRCAQRVAGEAKGRRARQAFDMDGYVAAIEARARGQVPARATRGRGLRDARRERRRSTPAFAGLPRDGTARDVAIRRYVRSWASGIRACASRRPEFHPGESMSIGRRTTPRATRSPRSCARESPTARGIPP
jgi:hypothetical protein